VYVPSYLFIEVYVPSYLFIEVYVPSHESKRSCIFWDFFVVVVYMYFGHVYMCVQGIIDIIVSIN
jgi:hypothetical protein